MKNINKILIAFISVLAISCSGDDVENRPVIVAGTAPVLLSPKSDFNIVLDKNKEADLATSVVWNKATYDGGATVITYSIEIAAAGTNFAKPSDAGTSTSTFKNFTVGELNSALLNSGFKPFVEHSIDIRVKSTLGGLGSTTGAILGTIFVMAGLEWMRFLDEPMDFMGIQTDAMPGMRMVVFSLILIVVMLFAREGLMGKKELKDLFKKKKANK